MVKCCFVLVLLIQSATCFAWYNPPCLKLSNHTNAPLVIEGDPNWDDQVLIVNGQQVAYLHSDLQPQAAISICGLWSEFGLDFYSRGQFVFVEISNLQPLPMVRLTTIPEYSLSYHTITHNAELLEIELQTVLNIKMSS